MLGDYLSVEDYDAIWGDSKRRARPSIRERLMLWVIVVGVGAALSFVAGCDGEAAQVTAYAEGEAHQRHVETLFQAGEIRRFPPTPTPIRASTLDAKVTACQQLPNRKWECDAQ